MKTLSVSPGNPFSELPTGEQTTYWADAAEFCRDILAEDLTSLNHGNWHPILPTVEQLLATPAKPCEVRTTPQEDAGAS